MSLNVGSIKSIVKPFLFNPKVVLFSDDFEDLSKWTQAETGGSYTVADSLLSVTADSDGHITFYTTNDVVRDFIAIYAKLRITGNTGIVELIGLCDTIPSDNTIHMNAIYNTSTGKFDINVYRGPSTDLDLIQSLNVDPNVWIEVLLIYVEGSFEGFVKREGVDDEWQPVFQYYDESLVPYMKKVWIGAHEGASIEYDKVIIYESAGTGLKDMRPLLDWSDGLYRPDRILRDEEGYYIFWATESYYGGGAGRRDRILILRTKDGINFEIVKSVIISKPGYTGQGILFKWNDGYIHGFLMNWRNDSPSYQNGLHRIVKVKLDENFNFVSLEEDVSLNNGPDGGSMGHYDIWLLKLDDKWYAITSSFTGGTQLWQLNDPVSKTFTHVKEIIPASNKENVTAYPVTNGSEKAIIMTIWDKDNDVIAIKKLNTSFDVVGDLATIQPRLSGRNGGCTILLPDQPFVEVIVHDHDLSPYNLLSHDAGYYANIYELSTDYKLIVELPPTPTAQAVAGVIQAFGDILTKILQLLPIIIFIIILVLMIRALKPEEEK